MYCLNKVYDDDDDDDDDDVYTLTIKIRSGLPVIEVFC